VVDFAAEVEDKYATWSVALADPEFDVLTYISSHDTKLMLTALGDDAAKQRQALTVLLLVPGAAQLFYGDESGRKTTVVPSDVTAGTRSDMNWSTVDAATLAHVQKIGAFRKKHGAVGAGVHTRLASPDGTYAFQRKLDAGAVQDAVVVVLARTP
jgi:alpha-amylase